MESAPVQGAEIESICVKIEPCEDVCITDEPRFETVVVKIEPDLEYVNVQDEPRCEDVSTKAEPSSSYVYVKIEPLDVSAADHAVKDEPALGPELVERSGVGHVPTGKSTPKRPFGKVADSKMEITVLQKQILEEEYVNKKKQWAFEEEERQHKREMRDLEKKLLLKKLQIQ
ncbi:uncharacterized protein LOC133532567 isoform X2 [Cydia pomonella]|uniref:uncharacterized protein LOC133532567 isoform X2 n=1 Tax=Cydia pomonella TaxID=82600 RepID=UPI002ADD4C0F|nr:uncharacterized protein LOC133532567 isoform X2 [Cydia pomonella]